MNEMLLQISKLDFCVQDATLFLDTHPNDKEALNYYLEATSRLNKLKKNYLNDGGVLTNRDGVNIDKYINEPFPWMKGENVCGYMKNACNIPLM